MPTSKPTPRARYRLEPHIREFAGFAGSAGQRVLEIGVGMGADYMEWLKAGAQATGVDLSSVSLEWAKRRCEMAGFTPDLRVSDAEHLPFSDHTFDVVYSYGVMHHSPDTSGCIREAWRVLKPGGTLRIMIYHHPSLTGIMLWLRYGFLRGETFRQSVRDHLESPGTGSYSDDKLGPCCAGSSRLSFGRPSAQEICCCTSLPHDFKGWLTESFGGCIRAFCFVC